MEKLSNFISRNLLGVCFAVLLLGLGGAFFSRAFAVADADVSDGPFRLITVTTGADFTLNLSEHPWTIVHLGLQDDGTTASATTDRLYIGMGKDALTATIADGNKIVLIPGSTVQVQGRDVFRSDDGAHVLRLRATGNECKVQLIRGK